MLGLQAPKPSLDLITTVELMSRTLAFDTRKVYKALTGPRCNVDVSLAFAEQTKMKLRDKMLIQFIAQSSVTPALA
jgi:hypothetical protein